MKNKISVLLAAVTVLFVGFTLGLFVGRNSGSGTVTLAVPAQMQTAPTAAATAPTQTVPDKTVSFPVNINTADAETLAALPGIGQVLAKRILAYRQQNGSFRVVEEITNVEGIGEKKAEAILELITVGG